MASTCYCVKNPGECGLVDTPTGYCSICPIDPEVPKTIKFTIGAEAPLPFEDSAYDSYAQWQEVLSPTATQVGGDHYAKNKIQPIDFILANNLGWCEANAVKYLTRWRNKNGLEDLRKAKHYIELLIERVEAGNE